MKKTILILTGTFLFMLLLNFLMPLHRDDYEYMLIWCTDVHIASLSDVATSLWRHYFLHGGRMVAFAPYETLLWLGKPWFNVANALVYTIFVITLCMHAARTTHVFREARLFLFAVILVWISLPHYGEVAVWACGSAVYLWTGLWVSLFLLSYNLHAAGNIRPGALWAIPMFFSGLLAGWSVENIGVTVVVVSSLYAIWMWRKKCFALWMASGAAGAFLGLCGLLLAPGNYVRYDDQNSGKNIFTHIGNQFAGNGEMLLYLLPVALLLWLTWRLLALRLSGKETGGESARKISTGDIVTGGIIALLLVSYFTGGWVAGAIRDFCIENILPVLGVTRQKPIEQFSHVMAGFEEMMIYLALIVLVYRMAKKAAGLDKAASLAARGVKWRDMLAAYPTLRYAAGLIALAFCNNFVMIAAPTFPARATFFSVSMILVATLAIFRMPEIKEIFPARAVSILKTGAAAVTLFLAAGTVILSWQMTEAQRVRIEMVEAKAGSGEILTFPPIETQNRALRHLFYVDFDNGVTKGGLCRYYGIKDIEVIGR